MNFLYKKRGIFLSFVIIFLIMFLHIPFLKIHFSWDSFQYIDLSIRDIIKNGPDEMRTPGYILIIDLLQWLFKKNFLDIIVVLQIVCFFISVFIFYMILERVNIPLVMRIILTCVYHFLIVEWVKAILPESLTLFLVVLWIYLFLLYLDKPQIWLGTTISAISFCMTMLRPSSLVFLLITLGFFLLKWIGEKNKYHLYSFVIAILMLLFCIFYCCLFYQKFGNFSLSNTLLRQRLYVAVQREYYQDSTDKEAIRMVEESDLPLWDKMLLLYDLPIDRRTKIYKESFKNNQIEYLEDTCLLLKEIAEEPFLARITTFSEKEQYGDIIAREKYNYVAESPVWFNNKDIFFNFLKMSLAKVINFRLVYIFLLLELGIIIIRFVNGKIFDWIESGLFITITGILLTTIFGTCAEWGRTAICCVPFIIIISGRLLNAGYAHFQRNERKKDDI